MVWVRTYPIGPVVVRCCAISPAYGPVKGHHDHQSMFADQGDEFHYHLPFPTANVGYSQVHWRKRVRLSIGQPQQVYLDGA